MAGLFKYLIAALIAFAAYNEFVMMHRTSVFDGLGLRTDKAAVIDAIGEPHFAYDCQAHQQALALTPYIDTLCKDKVEEVDAFPLCRLPIRCPGWDYIGFDHNNKLIIKYRLAD